ncbi:hypothetical protein [Streptomyces sp. C10]|uniref:hypothetical protein n=1 Tax=Streptomyces sp. C10 TaxID=531941 RepID=UPI00398045FE
MDIDIATALVGFGGALVGAGASMGSTWLTLKRQATEARRIRWLELGRSASDTALSELLKLHDLLEATTPSPGMPQEQPWEEQSKRHLRVAELALLRIPGDEVYERVMPSLRLAREYRHAGPREFHYIRQMRWMVEDMVSALSAYVREAELPPPHAHVAEAATTVTRNKEAESRRYEAYLREDFEDRDPDFAPDDAPL